MEIKSVHGFRLQLLHFCWCALLTLATMELSAQEHFPKYIVKNGKMYIELDKKLSMAALDSFIVQFELQDLELKQFVRNNHPDSLLKRGWKVEIAEGSYLLISKPLMALENISNPVSSILAMQKSQDLAAQFPSVSNRVVSGYNRFRNKHPFARRDSIVRFYLRNNQKATQVLLAGSFTNWQHEARAMTKTDTGWIADIVLSPGKFWYKFIVDGNWIVDGDNQLREHDGRGNTNSVYFYTNTMFFLPEHTQAKKVFVSGSFNNWKPSELEMYRTQEGWALPLYLADGTHTYKFIVDGRWMADPRNPVQIPDGEKGFNSVLNIGKPYLFRLNGFEHAKEVVLVGSFNNWREFELKLKKTGAGWELPYTLGAGNYEYKFKVDGKWVGDPANPLTSSNGNSFLVIRPNYTFRLKKHPDAKQVFIAGDFNAWKPDQLPMKKDGDDWIFSLHLDPGKVRYKFIIDGKWIIDPGNKQWEQNEYGTGNSVIWMEGAVRS